MAELAPIGETSRVTSAPERPSAERTRLLDALSNRAPRTTLDVASRAGFSVEATQVLLGTLELESVVEERERGWVKTRPNKHN
jgi:DNA processing protein